MRKRIFNDADDLDILHALYRGNHLEPYELERANKLLYLLNLEFKTRCKE